MTPLRDLQPSGKSAASVGQRRHHAHLFPPATAYRVRPGSDEGTPVPADERQFKNPPDGAILDYYLHEKSTTRVQLEIFDSQNNLIRSFASDDRTPPRPIPLPSNTLQTGSKPRNRSPPKPAPTASSGICASPFHQPSTNPISSTTAHSFRPALTPSNSPPTAPRPRNP